jgi:MFS family permease
MPTPENQNLNENQKDPLQVESSPDLLRKSLRFVTLGWVFGAAWLYITTGAALTRYALSLHVSEFGFGLLAALPFFCALIQLPTSYFLDRYGHRKKIFLLSGLPHRLTWILVAAVPFLFPAAWWPVVFLFLITLSGVGAQMVTPAYISWMADLVPSRIRGRFFSRRNQIGQFVGLVVTVLMGLALDKAQIVSPETMRSVISLLFVLAGICGSLDFIFFIPVENPPTHRPNPQVGFWAMFRRPLADKNFRHFLGYTATMTFAIGYIGQFIWLYLFNVVGLSNFRANLMLVVVPLVVMMISYPIWGRLVDRLGRKPVLLIAGLLFVHGGASWIFVRQDSWWLGYLAAMVATAAWPGIEIGNFNVLLNMAGTTKGRKQSTAFIAVNSVVVALAGMASGLFGGLVALYFKDWQGTLFGWPLTYHGLLFLLSAVLRIAALAWLIGMKDPNACSTRDAFRYFAADIYSNLQQAVFMPARLLGRLGKLTYRLNPPKK